MRFVDLSAGSRAAPARWRGRGGGAAVSAQAVAAPPEHLLRAHLAARAQAAQAPAGAPALVAVPAPGARHRPVGRGRAHAAGGGRRQRHGERRRAGDRHLPDHGCPALGRAHAARRCAGAGRADHRRARCRQPLSGDRHHAADRRGGLRAARGGARAAARHPARDGRHAVVSAGAFPRRGRGSGGGPAPALVSDRRASPRWSCRRGRARFRLSKLRTTSASRRSKCARSPPMPGSTRLTWR